jgi:hypothetical protein
MKKRLPILVVFVGVILVGLIIFIWPLIFTQNEINDSDKDGFPDEIDNCINTYSTVNNGCPEKNVKNQIDKDGDGFLLGFQKDIAKTDTDDNNPCIPNKKCRSCLIYKQKLALEKAKDTIYKEENEYIENINDEFLQFEQTGNDEAKTRIILNELLANDDKYRKLDMDKFNRLLIFAFNNFTNIVPKDKNSDEFLEICNQRNDLYYNMKKSKIPFNQTKIDNICQW